MSATDSGQGPSPLDESRIKGVAFREFLAWAAKQRREQLETVIATMDVQHARLFKPDHEHFGILPATWYPATVVHALLDGLCAGLSTGECDTLVREAATHVMNVTLSGIYRRLMSMLMTPQVYAKFSNKVWQSYYDTGTFKVSITDDKTAESSIEDWVAHHPVICVMNGEAANVIYAAMGKHAVSTERTHCVSEGAERCRFITTWA